MTDLPPGSRAVAGPGGLRVTAWWRPGPDPAAAGLARAERLADLDARLRVAVAGRRARLDPGAALLLSGGLDSSLLAGALCALEPERELAAFASASVAGRGAGDAAARAAMARRWPNLRLTEVSSEGLDPLDGAEVWWRRSAMPNLDVTFFNALALGRRAAEGGARGLLTGFGGDHVLSAPGGARLREDLAALRLVAAAEAWAAQGEAGKTRRSRLVDGLVRRSAANRWLRPRARLRRTLAAALHPGRAAARLAAWGAAGLDASDDAPPTLLGEARAALARNPDWALFDLEGVGLEGVGLEGVGLEGASLQGASLQGASLQGASLQGAGQDGAGLETIGQAGAGLEGAGGAGLVWGAPLLDTRLLAGAMAAPGSMLIAGGRRRALARSLLAPYAPAEVVTRTGKDPFQPDILALFRAALPRLRADLRGMHADLPLWREVVDADALARRLARIEATPDPAAGPLWFPVLRAWFLGEFLRLAEG